MRKMAKQAVRLSRSENNPPAGGLILCLRNELDRGRPPSLKLRRGKGDSCAKFTMYNEKCTM